MSKYKQRRMFVIYLVRKANECLLLTKQSFTFSSRAIDESLDRESLAVRQHKVNASDFELEQKNMSKFQVYGQKRAAHKRLIQRAMDDAEIDGVGLAKKAGVTKQAVSATLNGHIHSKKVLNALREIGVAESLLFDPRNKKAAA